MVKFLFLLLLFQGAGAEAVLGGGDECMPARCGDSGPTIRFPFWLKDHQPPHCGFPYDPLFTLSCSPTNNQTLFHLLSSFSLNITVQNINYQYQYVEYQPTTDCTPLTHLNLSTLPFHDYHRYWNYSLFRCPSTDLLYPPFGFYCYARPIICLNSPGHYVYAIGGCPMEMLLTCTKIIDIPWYLLDFFVGGTEFSWDEPKCQDCEVKGNYCKLRNNSNETQCFPIPGQLIPKPPIGSHTSGTKSNKNLEVKDVVPWFGLSLLVVGAIAIFVAIRSNKLKKEDQVKIERFLEDYRALKPTRYTYVEIKKITDQFKEKLGQGGYGTVYKGKLSNDVYVAAKILSNFKGKGEDFINEVGTIGMIHHVNVVRLVGYSADGYKRALVYEYLPNSLQKVISSDEKKLSLGWLKLQDIALGIAKGIEYLHQGCDQRILHFDIKPHNVLLDQNFNPKISDFGLAKLCSKEQSVVSMTAARGTVGYIAPEVFSRNFGNVSHKSDVYSFGMLLLEIVGGRKNTDLMGENSDDVYFPEWIYNQLNHGDENKIEIAEDEDAKIVKKLTVVGLWCIQWYPAGRPSMKVVVQMLEGDGSILAMPPSPFSTKNTSTSSGNTGGSSFSSMLEVISESE